MGLCCRPESAYRGSAAPVWHSWRRQAEYFSSLGGIVISHHDQLMSAFRVLARLIAMGMVVTSSTAGTAWAAPDSDSRVPPGGVYWGAYVPGAPFDASLLDVFEARSGKRMSLVHWGQPWVMNGAFMPFQAAHYQMVRNRGAVPLVTWGSWELGKGPNQPAYRLREITGGKYDAYIKQWAQTARAWGQPFFLRFDHEMNGWWQFPWAEQTNGNRPGEFVAAWRHVHDLFAQQGATNVTWVWCPNISGPQTTSLADVYPGDAYVDWTCMDGYNWGTDYGNLWQTFAEVFAGSWYNANHNTYAELLALAPDKPIMLGEVASSEHGGNKSAWIADMLTQLPRSFPQIRALAWMDWNTGDPTLTWPLASSAPAYDAFATGIAAPEYAPNQFAAQSSLLGPLAFLPAASQTPPPAPPAEPAPAAPTDAPTPPDAPAD